MNPQLPADILPVGTYRVDGDEQAFADLLIGVPLRYQRQHLPLPGGEPGESGGVLRGEGLLAAEPVQGLCGNLDVFSEADEAFRSLHSLYSEPDSISRLLLRAGP